MNTASSPSLVTLAAMFLQPFFKLQPEMNFVYKVFAIVYRTYEDKGNHSPYFDTILTVVFLLYLHVVHIGLLFNLPSDYIMPWSSQESKGLQWLKASVYFSIPILTIALAFKKRRIEKVPISNDQIYKGRKALPVYFAVSIILLFVLLVRHGVRKGTINF
jgi:hypothetical protein